MKTKFDYAAPMKSNAVSLVGYIARWIADISLVILLIALMCVDLEQLL